MDARLVSAHLWDCFEEDCAHSIDVTGSVGTEIECPACGAVYEVTREAFERTVTEHGVALVGCAKYRDNGTGSCRRCGRAWSSHIEDYS